ncbi:hypothetical protein BaRGS_00005952 [Batillaria attramentaria]|uniref:Uncharacterized protein n=1 Tax=Batillaria attramentaria TaxID=370345 RepID=A0ABD0LTU2_9CAEN
MLGTRLPGVLHGDPTFVSSRQHNVISLKADVLKIRDKGPARRALLQVYAKRSHVCIILPTRRPFPKGRTRCLWAAKPAVRTGRDSSLHSLSLRAARAPV